jgi:hypothetical protein
LGKNARIMLIRFVLAGWLFAAMPAPGWAATVEKHSVGPWPVVSQIIGYQDRIWFANSVKGVNHNSADLYSIGLEDAAPRYEWHLFSQDAGDPAVHNGLLYWPSEDARAGPGVGAFDVTDGGRWEHGLVPTAQAFHIHAMVSVDGYLYAAPSAWKASIARSADGGATWAGLYLHPTADRKVSRITALASLNGQVFGTLGAPEGRQLIRVDDGSGTPVPGWPVRREVAGLTAHHGWLYGLVSGADETVIWRTDGARSQPVWTAPDGWSPTSITSDGTNLWMVGQRDGESRLWQARDGLDWRETAVLPDGSAQSLVAYRGLVAIGGRGEDGRGILWTVRDGPPMRQAILPVVWPDLFPMPRVPVDWDQEARALDTLLSAPKGYAGYGLQLRQRINNLPRTNVPSDFYNQRLAARMPRTPLPLFGDIVLDEMAVMGRWRIYWGMGWSRTGRVSPSDILRPADYTLNRPAKYFSTAEMAMWAAGRLGQRDRATLASLIARLEDPGTPLWLKGDAVGALTAITGRRFGYDGKAWRDWFSEPLPHIPDSD